MNLQVIKSLDGTDEYVLLPVAVYRALKDVIDDELAGLDALEGGDDVDEPFDPADYVKNPVALARLKARVARTELAGRLGVSEQQLSDLEQAETVADDTLVKIRTLLGE